MVIFQSLLFVFLGFAVVAYYAAARFKQKKQAEYGNDERWKAIVASAAQAIYRYYTALLVVVVMGTFVYRITDFDIQLGLGDVFGLLFLVLLGGSAVELIALYMYDKKM